MAKHDDEIEEVNQPVEQDKPADAATTDFQVKVEELTNDLKRVQAEFINYRRRAEAEKAELLDFAKNRVVREFLAVRDSFDHEQSQRPKDADPAWAKSIDAIRSQFDQALQSLGVTRLRSLGQSFDPHLHEAVMIDDGEGEHEVVVEELRPGYKIGDSILRHAVVKVGRTSQAPPVPDLERNVNDDNEKENK